MDDIFPDAVQSSCGVISIGSMEWNGWGDAFAGRDFPIRPNFRRGMHRPYGSFGEFKTRRN